MQITITPELLSAFAELTGDYNALHMDDVAARDFAYRQRVVHGMLPVSLLFLTEPLMTGRLKKISGKFMHPVFVGDTVRLELAPLESGWSYTIYSSSVTGPVTYGEFVTEGRGTRDEGRERLTSSSLVLRPSSFVTSRLTQNTLNIHQIQKGQSEEFGFTVTPEACEAWLKLLQAKYPPADIFNPDLAAVLLCSTLVGMRLPGRMATFLDFTLQFDGSIEFNTEYFLKGRVDFVSQASQIIIDSVSASAKNGGHPVLEGKLTVKMNEPSLPQPTFEDIKARSLDLGLKGKTVLVTGASRGIGAATARLFACHGAKVVVNYLKKKDDADSVVADITKNGGQAIVIAADVRDRGQVKAMFDQARASFGEVDVLVNNAAGDFLSVPFGSLTWERVQEDIDVVVKGAFNCCQEAVPSMVKNKSGRIVNVVTVATETPPPQKMKYVIAKSALIGLTRSLAVELAPHQVLVNMVMPGMVETDMTKTIPPAVRDKIKLSIPLQRHTSTLDVAQAIVMLASNQAGYTTGQKMFVTGGLPPFA